MSLEKLIFNIKEISKAVELLRRLGMLSSPIFLVDHSIRSWQTIEMETPSQEIEYAQSPSSRFFAHCAPHDKSHTERLSSIGSSSRSSFFDLEAALPIRQ